MVLFSNLFNAFVITAMHLYNNAMSNEFEYSFEFRVNLVIFEH